MKKFPHFCGATYQADDETDTTWVHDANGDFIEPRWVWANSPNAARDIFMKDVDDDPNKVMFMFLIQSQPF